MTDPTTGAVTLKARSIGLPRRHVRNRLLLHQQRRTRSVHRENGEGDSVGVIPHQLALTKTM
jgi:hypothetical protein